MKESEVYIYILAVTNLLTNPLYITKKKNVRRSKYIPVIPVHYAYSTDSLQRK